MKKFTLIVAIVFAFAANMFAQTIVGTDPENKNVVLEEFTGIYCGYCPLGHAIAQGIYDAHPDDVVLIAIHTGSYANPSGNDPDFRTPFGGAIAGQSALTGYPSGTVNRHLFPGWSMGSGTAMDRGKWSPASDLVLAEASYLNVGCEATIITSTRQLVVNVEVYYTGDSPQSTNLLNVAILQNNIHGPQSGGGAGNNYIHKHMLRYLLTGQWGETISETSEGSLYATTLVYDIPADYNDVEVVLEDLDIVAFVSETHQEIVSGIKGNVTYVESLALDAGIIGSNIPQTSCGAEMEAQVTVKNYGTDNLTSLDFEYGINGDQSETYTWTGNLAQNEIAVVTLPSFAIDANQSNVFSLVSNNPNGGVDELPGNNNATADFEQTAYLPQNCKLAILTDQHPEETTWDIKDSEGTIIASGGPYNITSIFIEEFTWPSNDCFTLTMYDAGGNGLDGGFYKIIKSNNSPIWQGNNDFGSSTSAQFAYDEVMDVQPLANKNSINIYPNPIIETAQIEFSLLQQSTVQMGLYDILGKQVIQIYSGKLPSGSQYFQINTANLDKGIYFVNMEIDGVKYSKKVSVL